MTCLYVNVCLNSYAPSCPGVQMCNQDGGECAQQEEAGRQEVVLGAYKFANDVGDCSKDSLSRG